MKHKTRAAMIAGLATAIAMSQASAAQVRITEWMYNGVAEFVEFTNIGSTSVDFAGWSYDDDSDIPGVFDLSPFGLVAPGESVVMTEAPAAEFRAWWALPESVRILGEYTNNLGRNDQINLYDSSGVLVDRLTYGDTAFPGTIRTQGTSGRPLSLAALGADDIYQWVFSVIGDVDGGYLSTLGEIGSPGSYNIVPVPAAVWLFGSALGGLVALRRRRSA